MFAPHEGGGGGVAPALPTRTFIGNSARFVMTDQVASRYIDCISSSLSCIGAASAGCIQGYRQDANRLTMTKLGELASYSRSPSHSWLGIRPVHQTDPNQNIPALTNVTHKQTITRTHVLTCTLAPCMFISCPCGSHRCLA